MRVCLTFVVCICLTCTTNAQDKAADETKTRLAEAKTTFERESAKARQELVVAMESLLREVAKTGDLDEVESLMKQLEALKADGTVPSTRKLNDATQAFKKQIQTNVLAVRDIFEQAIRDHTQRLEVDQARDIQKARDEFLKHESPVAEVAERARANVIALSKVNGLNLIATYDNPSLPFVYETWDWILKPEAAGFKVIHATHGEAFPTTVTSIGSWHDLSIDEDGYFFMHGKRGAQGGHVKFVIKRYRPNAE